MVQVELATSQGRTDINLALEDAFIPILKSVYNLPHLINLNRKQKNFPGIDLGDDHDRVAFQVTSTTSLEKVKATVSQFMERRYFNTFDELFILTLVKKQSSYSQSSVNKLLTDEFAFNCKKHIIDLGDILAQVSALRLAAQERILAEFKQILGDVDAYLSFSTDSVAAPMEITSNLLEIDLPQDVYVAELSIDEKAVIREAKASLNYKGRASGKKSIVKMALLLNGVDTDSWVYYENKLFSFHDIERSGLLTVVDEGTIEQLDASDLSQSEEVDNINVFKQLLFAETQEELKSRNVQTHSKDRFFFFSPTAEGDKERVETWVGKKTANRRVYEIKQQKKDPSKVAHHKHLSFEMTFTKFGDDWYAQLIPSWYYSYNGYKQSRWHQDLLSEQKRKETNQAVRNHVRFIAYFLANLAKDEGGLRFKSLVEFNMQDEDGDQSAVEAEIETSGKAVA
jgi:hypothetical protein